MVDNLIITKIKEGNKELIPVLWNQVNKWVYLCADKYFLRNAEQCRRSGTTAEDLRQEGYFAFLDAIDTYKADECSFITWLKYPLLNVFNSLSGIRTAKTRKEPLSGADSLNKPIRVKEDEMTLEELLEDTRAQKPFESVEDNLFTQQLHSTLDAAMKKSLSEREREVIALRYYDGKTLLEVSHALGCSQSYPHEIERQAIRKLRHDTALKEYREFVISHSYQMGGCRQFNYTGTSSTEWAALKLAERCGK